MTCKFKLDECSGSKQVLMPQLLLAPVRFLQKGLSEFNVRRWTVVVFCPRALQPIWPACSLDSPDKSVNSLVKAVQVAWEVYRGSWSLFPPELVLSLRAARDRSDVDGFGVFGVPVLRLGYSEPICVRVGPIQMVCRHFGVEVLCRCGSGGWGEQRLVGTWRAYHIRSAVDVLDVASVHFFVNSSLALFFSGVGIICCGCA